MWKVLTFLRRKPEMTREEFVRYWRDEHVPLMQQQEDFWRHVRKYVQNYSIDEVDNEYDGVSELWFDSAEELKAAFDEPGFATVREDTRTFADVAGSKSVVGEYVPHKDGDRSGIKIMGGGHRRQDLTREQAQDHWRNRHPQHCARVTPEFWSFIKHYNQNHVRVVEGVALETLTDEYDFSVESGYDSLESMEESRKPEYQYMELVRPDELEFVSMDDAMRVITRESVIYEQTT